MREWYIPACYNPRAGCLSPFCTFSQPREEVSVSSDAAPQPREEVSVSSDAAPQPREEQSSPRYPNPGRAVIASLYHPGSTVQQEVHHPGSTVQQEVHHPGNSRKRDIPTRVTAGRGIYPPGYSKEKDTYPGTARRGTPTRVTARGIYHPGNGKRDIPPGYQESTTLPG